MNDYETLTKAFKSVNIKFEEDENAGYKDIEIPTLDDPSIDMVFQFDLGGKLTNYYVCMRRN